MTSVTQYPDPLFRTKVFIPSAARSVPCWDYSWDPPQKLQLTWESNVWPLPKVASCQGLVRVVDTKVLSLLGTSLNCDLTLVDPIGSAESSVTLLYVNSSSAQTCFPCYLTDIILQSSPLQIGLWLRFFFLRNPIYDIYIYKAPNRSMTYNERVVCA